MTKETKDVVKNESVNSIKSKKTKSKETEITKFDIEGKFIHIKVGNEVKPAEDKDVASIEEKVTEIIEENNIKCIVFVTHHAVEVKVYWRKVNRLL